jgi:hypothetical protein
LNNLLDKTSEGWVLVSATAINDKGQIVGVGMLNGYYRAYALTPVPEPASIGWLPAMLVLVVRDNAVRRKFDPQRHPTL